MPLGVVEEVADYARELGAGPRHHHVVPEAEGDRHARARGAADHLADEVPEVDRLDRRLFAGIEPDSDDVAEDRRLLDAAKVDHAAALQTAGAEVPQGRVVDLDLDEDDGSVAWDVEVIAPDHAMHELTINAVTGAVTKHETD